MFKLQSKMFGMLFETQCRWRSELKITTQNKTNYISQHLYSANQKFNTSSQSYREERHKQR